MASNIIGLGKIEDFLFSLGKETERKLEKVMISGGTAIQNISKSNLKTNGSFNNGDLHNSIQSTKNFAPDILEVEVGSHLKYAPYIEFGTKPHYPPTAPLKRWAEQHGFQNPAWGAHLIALKISHHGTKAKPYLIPAYNKVAPKVFKKINEVIQGIS